MTRIINGLIHVPMGLMKAIAVLEAFIGMTFIGMTGRPRV
jgi:hypothetical protein